MSHYAHSNGNVYRAGQMIGWEGYLYRPAGLADAITRGWCEICGVIQWIDGSQAVIHDTKAGRVIVDLAEGKPGIAIDVCVEQKGEDPVTEV